MPRQANAVDFWRGFALVSIFVNHIPGIWFERLTHRNFSISDSAELFVFLAGWSLGLLVSSRSAATNSALLVFRLGGRAVTIYAAQILISSIALALLASAAYAFDNPLILEWHNAAAIFQEPALTHIGLVLLSHHLGYFDAPPDQPAVIEVERGQANPTLDTIVRLAAALKVEPSELLVLDR